MFFKKKKGKTPKTSNRKVVPNMKPIEELRTNLKQKKHTGM